MKTNRLAVMAGFLITVLVWGEGTAPAARLHLVAFGDLHDPQLGSFVRQDLSRIKSVTGTGVAYSQLHSLTLPDDLTSDHLFAAISALTVSRDDALMLYFSGPGAYDKSRGHYVILTDPRTKAKNVIFRSDLLQAIQRKNPRLAVVITDACFTRRDRVIEPPDLVAPAVPETTPLFRKLFFRSQGIVDVNSCGRDEIALTYQRSNEGSLFTSAFSKTLLRFLEDGSLGWDDVLRETSALTQAEFKRIFVDEYPFALGSDAPQTTQTPTRLQFEIEEVPGTSRPVELRHVPNARLGGSFEMQRGRVTLVGMVGGAPLLYCYDPSGKRWELTPGDAIESVNGTPVKTLHQFHVAVRDSPMNMSFVVRGTDGSKHQFWTRLNHLEAD